MLQSNPPPGKLFLPEAKELIPHSGDGGVAEGHRLVFTDQPIHVVEHLVVFLEVLVGAALMDREAHRGRLPRLCLLDVKTDDPLHVPGRHHPVDLGILRNLHQRLSVHRIHEGRGAGREDGFLGDSIRCGTNGDAFVPARQLVPRRSVLRPDLAAGRKRRRARRVPVSHDALLQLKTGRVKAGAKCFWNAQPLLTEFRPSELEHLRNLIPAVGRHRHAVTGRIGAAARLLCRDAWSDAILHPGTLHERAVHMQVHPDLGPVLVAGFLDVGLHLLA